MANKEIRTKHIKSLVADKDAMAKVLEESTKESLSSLLDESVNRSLRQMLAESDNDSYEEEVTTEKPNFDDEPEISNDNDDTTDGDNANGDDDISINLGSGDEGAEGCKNGKCSDSTDGDEVWAGLEDCKDSDGEYDLRGKDIESVINILKTIEQMAPDTDVRIIKNDDDTIEVEGCDEETGDDMTNGDDNDDQIDFEFEMGSETDDDDYDVDDYEDDGYDDEDNEDYDNEDYEDEDPSFELEVGDDNDETQDNDMVNEGNVNLGYTSNYQNKSALTMPTDKGEREGDSRFDGGATTGGANNKKRWPGTNGADGGNPYSKKIKQSMTEEANECGYGCSANEDDEDTLFEVSLGDGLNDNEPSMSSDSRLEEVSTITRNNGLTNSTGHKEIHSRYQRSKVRNGFEGGEQQRGTGDGRGTKGTDESRIAKISRQANAIMSENKDLKDIAAQLKQQLSEAVLINASLAKVIRLVTENATSRDEKINILNRFNKVQSLNECKNLYTQISAELAKAHPTNNNLLNKQLTEAKSLNKNMIVETNMLNQSEDLRQILDLNERLMKLGK